VESGGGGRRLTATERAEDGKAWAAKSFSALPAITDFEAIARAESYAALPED
jgi:hypothetical protein